MNQLYHSWVCMYTKDSTELQRHSCIHVYVCIIRRDKAMGTNMDEHSTEGCDEVVVHRHKGVLAVTKNEIYREVSETGK